MTTLDRPPGTPAVTTSDAGLAQPRSRFLFPIVVAAAVFQAVLQTVIVPLLPELPHFTGAGRTAVSWLVTVTLLVGAVVTPIFGRLADMFGKKKMLLVAFSMMTLGSMLCALSSDIAVLIFARALQGAGSAVIPIGISMLRDELPRNKVNGAVAMMSSTLGVGTALGIPFSAMIAQYSNWHVLFWVTTAIGLSVTLAAVLFIRESEPNPSGRFDGVGAVGLSAAMIALLVPITQGSSWGWTSGAVISMLAASAVLFALWVIQQRRNVNPLVDVRALVKRAVLIPHLAALLVGFAFFGNTLITTQLLQGMKGPGAGYGLSIIAAALCQIPASIAMVLFSPVAVRITDRFGSRTAMLTGAVFLAGGYGIHAVAGKPLWGVVAALGITAVGTAIVYSTLSLLILVAVPRQRLAAANGVNSLLRTSGSTICSATVATILAAFVISGSEHSTSWTGFSVAYLVCAGCAVVVFAVSILLPQGRTPKHLDLPDLVRRP
ncbi:MFS transporter [Rhodococcus qingshengii]|uniref:MFS transporter n=1 Tax=Rhodococcus TaxID=1827 RepID=UPI0006BA1D63|nr:MULTISPECIES: MFS transporter [Rhodococcus]REK81407.1 MFS transporter [Rhodococcus erythropolis]KPH16028.1 MFS transporter [Rhodococcus sp. ADH]KSU76356.1 MFS transporter [Rhodococcus qingshengii]MBP2526506.1 MFS family permease [Rhodococcus sp. PvP104]MDA3633921.1 MFS transporter [Rhodococcus sp. C-2]